MPEALEKKFEAAVDVSDANDALPAAPTMIEGMDEEACNLLWWLEGGKDNQYKWWCDKGERWREERINFWWVDKSLDAHKISVLHTHISTSRSAISASSTSAAAPPHAERMATTSRSRCWLRRSRPRAFRTCRTYILRATS